MHEFVTMVPMGCDRKIVHVYRKNWFREGAVQFISFERDAPIPYSYPVNGRGDILVIRMESLATAAIKSELAFIDGVSVEKISVELHLDAAVTVTGSEDPYRPLVRTLGTHVEHANDRYVRRTQRSNALAATTPTRGWDPR